MIEIRHLSKSFGALKAVDNISFDVAPGEVLGFLGPNGAGKSTTMKIITGYLNPTGGTVSVCGHDMGSEPRLAQARMGYLPEGAPCYEEMTPLSFLAFIADVRGLTGQRRSERLEQVIHQVSLQPVLHQPIETLSKGFKRRVGLAQALLHDPQVLILDEPTDGLDPNQKHQVREMIRSLSKEKIVIISTHILEEVSAVCTRAVIISQGRILADATPAELEARSKFHQAVSLRLRQADDAAKVVPVLREMPEVAGLAQEGAQVTLFPAQTDGRLLMAVTERIHDNQWSVDAVFLERGHMDEVFREITQGELS